jgi:uncharacterized oxidoreductase
MQITGNTILITGGSSGIGRALAEAFHKAGNKVIVAGRRQALLDEVTAANPGMESASLDVQDIDSLPGFAADIARQFPTLNVLINNAGIMRKINIHAPAPDLYDITREIEINLVAPIRMVKQFLPHLKQKKAAAIVNVSSGLAFVPFAISPVYSATKAAVHSFTQSLRVQLKNTHVKVFELAPPGTDTALFRGDFTEEDVKGVTPMDVATLAKHAIDGMSKDVYEIRPGLANALKLMSRVAPQFILRQLSKSADNMLSQSKSQP